MLVMLQVIVGTLTAFQPYCAVFLQSEYEAQHTWNDFKVQEMKQDTMFNFACSVN